jgi:transaldolase
MDDVVSQLKIKIFADGANLTDMIEMSQKPFISGLTTNPTLMRKAKITDYKQFALNVLSEIKEKPISFEVFSDDLEEMKKQGETIASWGENVFVKIPVSNTRKESTHNVINYLVKKGVKVNVTALMTHEQVTNVLRVLEENVPSYISVFAGRIADTGRDPIPVMEEALTAMASNNQAELIWASPRELLNIFQANGIGCHIITATNDILKKLDLVGKDLTEYSLETVKMFYNDGQASNFKISHNQGNS